MTLHVPLLPPFAPQQHLTSTGYHLFISSGFYRRHFKELSSRDLKKFLGTGNTKAGKLQTQANILKLTPELDFLIRELQTKEINNWP
jgi:hypothetical protein